MTAKNDQQLIEQPKKEHVGNLRPKITYEGKVEHYVNGEPVVNQSFKVEWIEGQDVNNVVFTERIKVPLGMSFVPSIGGYGTYTKQGGFYVDSDNSRHFVMPVPMGVFGASTNPEPSELGR